MALLPFLGVSLSDHTCMQIPFEFVFNSFVDFVIEGIFARTRMSLRDLVCGWLKICLSLGCC